MIQNSTRITTKCECDNPKWNIVERGSVRSGKQCGKKYVIVYCSNCRKQFKSSAVEKIETAITNQQIN